VKVRVEYFAKSTVAALLLVGCSSAPGELTIVTKSGGSPKGVPGDAIALEVMQGGEELPAGTTVTWTGVPTVTALDPGSTAASPLPAPGEDPTAMFVTIPSRPDVAPVVANVLFILDPGTKAGGEIELTATVEGSGTASISIPVGGALTGDAANGAMLYVKGGADCAFCHGAGGQGSPPGPNGMYSYDGGMWAYPAPALDPASGHIGSTPGWNAALFTMASRAVINNRGVALREPMPSWIVQPNTATDEPLSTQDFADIYAFLETQPPP